MKYTELALARTFVETLAAWGLFTIVCATASFIGWLALSLTAYNIPYIDIFGLSLFIAVVAKYIKICIRL